MMKLLPSWFGWLVSALLGGALTACGGGDPSVTTTGSGGGGGQQPEPCAAGSVRVDDGSCVALGVSACPTGFEIDPAGGCMPLLPADPCPDGEMALPGDTSCHPLMDCGMAPWGEIPVEAGTEYVDPSYTGGDSDGTATKPWTTVQQAATAGTEGDIIALAEGSYVELFYFSKAFRLWGRCPQLVSVEPPSVTDDVYVAVDGMEIHGVTLVTTGSFGVLADSALDLVIDRVHIVGDAEIGIAVFGNTEPATARIQDTLIEGTTSAGLLAIAATLDVSNVAFREMVPSTMYGGARSIDLEYDPTYMTVSSATVSRVLVEDATEVGLAVLSSDMVMSDSAVLRTRPRVTDDRFGIGIAIQPTSGNVGGLPSVVQLERTTIADSYAFGVTNLASQVTLVDTTVAGVSLQANDDSFGDGVVVMGQQAELVGETSVVRDAGRAGVANFWAHAELSGMRLDCNTFHLNAEQQQGPYVFEVSPLNACSCGGEPELCQIVSSGLKPPDPL